MTTTNTPIPDFTKIVLSDDPKYMTVWFSWKLSEGYLDRPISYGMSCLPRHVPRLTRAFLEGKLFPYPELVFDINGQWYIAGDCAVYGKRINADLTRLGY